MSFPTIWQIGTGDPGRPYFSWMNKYGVAFLGPGGHGPWLHERYADNHALKRFVDADVGDLIVARRGRSEVLGIGVIEGEYDHDDRFDDVEGWDLQHYRRVRWVSTEPRSFGRMLFSRDRFSRCLADEVRQLAEEQIGADELQRDSAALPELPPWKKPLDIVDAPELQEIVDRAGKWADEIWTGKFGGYPSESELLCHLTVPLLLALGWDREQIAVEWGRMDIAVFEGELPRAPEKCRLVIEGKRLGRGLEPAREQAQGYVSQLRQAEAVDYMVTDGLRYQLYAGPETDQIAYAHLGRLKEDADDLFERLRPDSV